MQLLFQLLAYGGLLIGPAVLGYAGKIEAMGLMILAGAIALAFLHIDKIARFKGAGFEAEMRDQLETILEKETEPELRESTDAPTPLDAAAEYELDTGGTAVVRALRDSDYTWRYIGGLARDAAVPQADCAQTLQRLIVNQLAKESRSKGGRIFSLTSKGREVFRQL